MPSQAQISNPLEFQGFNVPRFPNPLPGPPRRAANLDSGGLTIDRPDPSTVSSRPDQRPSRSGAIFLQASTRPCSAPTDLSKASRSLPPPSSISTMRSTPFDPITTGTPTYMSFTPYSPLR